MIKVSVKNKPHSAISSAKLKKELTKFFKEQGITSDAQVDVAVVGDSQMKKLAREYLGEKDELHNVLSFTASEAKENFVYPPDSTIHLGEIILCYSKVLEEANSEGKLVDEKAIELAKHGGLHLLGIHHQ